MNKYYVYGHLETETGQVVYIGKGCAGRAWNTNMRSEEHISWMESHDLWQCVFSYATGLSNEEAYELESDLIKEHSPVFNKYLKNQEEDQHKRKYTKQEKSKSFTNRLTSIVNSYTIVGSHRT